MAEMEMAPYIETYTGKKMYFLDPKPEMICIEDIAHALANACRFGGHTITFYSVAQHSITVAELAENRLEGLLHDASEAYLVDIPKPIKGHLTSYKTIENNLMAAIAERFGAGWPISEDTHDADVMQLRMEAKHLMRTRGDDWRNDWKTKRTEGIIPVPCAPHMAQKMFTEYFHKLTNNTKDSAWWPEFKFNKGSPE